MYILFDALLLVNNYVRNLGEKYVFLDYWANSGFWFCDMILGFGVISGLWSFDTNFGVQGSGFSFFGTILGFGDQGFVFL